jgi:hypothetical protein
LLSLVEQVAVVAVAVRVGIEHLLELRAVELLRNRHSTWLYQPTTQLLWVLAELLVKVEVQHLAVRVAHLYFQQLHLLVVAVVVVAHLKVVRQVVQAVAVVSQTADLER